MYTMSRLDENNVVIRTKDGQDIAKIPADAETSIDMSEGIAALIAKYGYEEVIFEADS